MGMVNNMIIYGWFKHHINITWGIFTLLQFTGILFESSIPFIILRLLWFGVTLWALSQKGRCFLWVLIPISVLFLPNNNHKVITSDTKGIQ